MDNRFVKPTVEIVKIVSSTRASMSESEVGVNELTGKQQRQREHSFSFERLVETSEENKDEEENV
jgi:hypothetical protein